MIEDFRPLSSLSAFTKFHDGWDRLRLKIDIRNVEVDELADAYTR